MHILQCCLVDWPQPPWWGESYYFFSTIWPFWLSKFLVKHEWRCCSVRLQAAQVPAWGGSEAQRCRSSENCWALRVPVTTSHPVEESFRIPFIINYIANTITIKPNCPTSEPRPRLHPGAGPRVSSRHRSSVWDQWSGFNNSNIEVHSQCSDKQAVLRSFTLPTD